MGVKGYLVVLICISLKINNVEHLSMCLLAICLSFLEKYLQVLCSFKNLFVVVFKSSLYILNNNSSDV